MTFDPSQPTDDTKIRDLSTVITPNWEAIQGADASFKPIGINFNNRNPLPSNDDPTAIANAYILYCKEDPGAIPELFGIDAASNVLQFTGGPSTLNNNGHTFLIGGLLFQWFHATVNNNTIVQFPKEFGAVPYVVIGSESTNNITDFDFVKSPVAEYKTNEFKVFLVRADGNPQNNVKLLTFMAIGPAYS